MLASCFNMPDTLYIWFENKTGCLDINSCEDVEVAIPCLVTRVTKREITLTIPQIIPAVKFYQRAVAVSGNNVPVALGGAITNIRHIAKWTQINVELTR